YVLDDGEYYAQNLLEGFDNAARKVGLRVVGAARWHPGSHSYASLATRIAQRRPDGVLLAGFGEPQLVRDLRARLGTGVALIAGDGFLTVPRLLHDTGDAARGMYVSFAGIPNGSLPKAGNSFVSAFATTQTNRKIASYGAAYGAQAAEVLLAAIARSDGTRGSVIRQLFAGKVRNAILGDFRFTGEGD